MAKTLYALLLGLVGAGIVHIAIVLLLPGVAEKDAWSRLATAGSLYQPIAVDDVDGPRLMQAPDPFFSVVACRFDLKDGPLRLTAEGTVPFWSASVYDRSGDNIYNFSDRTAGGGALDFVVITPAQMIEMRKELPAELEQAIFVEADIGEGIVVVRAFRPDASWRSILARYMQSVRCATQ